jgi:hypothetical protein
MSGLASWQINVRAFARDAGVAAEMLSDSSPSL